MIGAVGLGRIVDMTKKPNRWFRKLFLSDIPQEIIPIQVTNIDEFVVKLHEMEVMPSFPNAYIENIKENSDA